MNTEDTSQVSTTARTPKQRKTYHSPRIENYGAVNELTRSSISGSYDVTDGTTFYTSANG